MKFQITVLFLFLLSVVSAQSIKLNYEPKGLLIEFKYDSLTLYTDTIALFDTYRKEGNLVKYDLRVFNLVRKEICRAQNDTIKFSGDFIPFNDGIVENRQKSWYIKWAILQLTKANKLKMYDKHGTIVTKIKGKKIGTKKEGYIRRAFINKRTNEELFSEPLYFITGTPSF